MFSFMSIQQTQTDRLEDAGFIKYGEQANSVPKVDRGTLRTRFARSLREAVRGGGTR